MPANPPPAGGAESSIPAAVFPRDRAPAAWVEAGLLALLLWLFSRFDVWQSGLPWSLMPALAGGVGLEWLRRRAAGAAPARTGWLGPAVMALVTGAAAAMGAGSWRSAAVATLLQAALGALWGATSRGAKDDWIRALLIAGTVSVYEPFANARWLGGLDASWYLGHLTDALQQVRAGFFPVIAGQGEFAFNGAIHPFRSAPYYHWLGIVLDTVTGRMLGPIAIQHLTVLVSMVQGALLCAWGLNRLRPGREERAAVLAILYVLSPFALGYLIGQEMYMTCMAFGYLPLLPWANARLAQRDDLAGWCRLAGVVALLFCCHPLVGTLALSGSALFQGLRLALWGASAAQLGAAVLAGGLGGGMIAWNIVGTKEGTNVVSVAAGPLLLQYGPVAAGLWAVARTFVTGRWAWLGLAFAAAGVMAFVQASWAIWLAAAAGAALAGSRAVRRWPVVFGGPRQAWWLGGGLIALGIATLAVHPVHDSARDAVIDEIHHQFALVYPRYFLPLSPRVAELGDLQPGYAILALFVLGLIGAVRDPTRERVLLAMVTAVLSSLVAPVPGVTDFLFRLMPEPAFAVVGTAFWLRLTPLLSVLALFAGGLVVMSCDLSTRAWRIGMVVTAALALGWSAVESSKYALRLRGATFDARRTVEQLRPENRQLFAYSYDRFSIPGYFTAGVLDYHLESRLLRKQDGAILPDPWLQPEPGRGTKLSSWIDPADAHWVHLTPKLVVPPDQRQAWVFAFPEKSISGVVFLRGNRGLTRTYGLPASSMTDRSFGIGPLRQPYIAVWNSTAEPETIELVYYRDEVPPAEGAFGDFGEVTVVPYTEDKLRIAVRRLLPYAADVQAPEAVYLETSRSFLPGYVARVDGRPVQVEKSPNSLVMVPLEAGQHHVEVVLRGTTRFWAAFLVSFTSWAVLFALLWRARRASTV